MGYYKYKIGDYVIISPREGAEDEYPFTYTEPMLEAKGEIYQIAEITDCSTFPHILDLSFSNGDTNKYILSRCPYTSKDNTFDPHGYWWHSSMFKPFVDRISTKADIAEKPTPYADAKIGDEIYVCGYKGTLTIHSGRCYVYFSSVSKDHASICELLRADERLDFIKLRDKFGGTTSGYFPEFPTVAACTSFVDALNKQYDSLRCGREYDLLTTKLKENEIRFQKPQASIRRGSVPKGSTIYGRQHKIAIRVSPLADQVIFG